MITSEISDFINQEKLGFIATVCPDGTPNLSPKGTVAAWDSNHLVFLDIYSPGTVSNLLENPSIEINIVDIFNRKGYRFKGTAEVLSKGDVFDSILAMYGEAANKYKINNIVLVHVDRVLEIKSPVYSTRTSEAEIKERWVNYWNDINLRP
jgi:predicted pyridoxine 5'-phosphate oxidase superfamily flavin-nucleotide-binding protein